MTTRNSNAGLSIEMWVSFSIETHNFSVKYLRFLLYFHVIIFQSLLISAFYYSLKIIFKQKVTMSHVFLNCQLMSSNDEQTPHLFTYEHTI